MEVVVKKYVTGFLFSQDSSHVVLIKKINPAWQRGLFNGVGGKVEVNESSIDAMVRDGLLYKSPSPRDRTRSRMTACD